MAGTSPAMTVWKAQRPSLPTDERYAACRSGIQANSG
ncbi:hypothetical protein ABIF81_007585 [Bradyrhizobium daqingense]